MSKKVLNVGGNNKKIPLPPQYSEFEHVLLDIDPSGNPDVICDARELHTIEAVSFDAVYCSHNLEHYFKHDVKKVLSGFLHILKDGCCAQIKVPDIMELMKITIENNLDIEDVVYRTSANIPIMVLDVLYGWTSQIEKSGNDFFAHKTGFSKDSLISALYDAGFSEVFCATGNLEINAIAFKGKPNQEMLKKFGIN